MSYQAERVKRMQRTAMELIWYADVEGRDGLPTHIKTLMHTRAASLCALAMCETSIGELEHRDERINKYFNEAFDG